MPRKIHVGETKVIPIRIELQMLYKLDRRVQQMKNFEKKEFRHLINRNSLVLRAIAAILQKKTVS